jgi:hypothetical protein
MIFWESCLDLQDNPNLQVRWHISCKWAWDFYCKKISTELHLTELAALFDPGMALPVNKKIYVTVRAYNKAGL